MARWLPGGFQVARGHQESDEGDLGWPGGSQELPRWPGVARSLMMGAWDGQVSSRKFPGGRGSPGVGLMGPGVARWLPGGCQVARRRQGSQGFAVKGQVLY